MSEFTSLRVSKDEADEAMSKPVSALPDPHYRATRTDVKEAESLLEEGYTTFLSVSGFASMLLSR